MVSGTFADDDHRRADDFALQFVPLLEHVQDLVFFAGLLPDRFVAEQPPELVPSDVEGCQAAPALDPTLHYCAATEYWYRFAMNRWYLAFAWNGNWFPVSGAELPRGLAKITPATRVETVKTREERLEELERKLEKLEGEELDGQEQAP